MALNDKIIKLAFNDLNFKVFEDGTEFQIAV